MGGYLLIAGLILIYLATTQKLSQLVRALTGVNAQQAATSVKPK